MGLYDRQKDIKLNQEQSILICGCGGIGYWVAKYAAMSGIEKIYLYDFDTIEEHNLNRLDLPIETIGKNKAMVTKVVINELRPYSTVYAFPYKLTAGNVMKADWFIDCTDKWEVQMENQKIAQEKGMRYVKAGYDGEHISINNVVAEWGTPTDGYTIIPSWVVPASVIAALTVAKIMKYYDAEISTDIRSILR